MIFVKLWTKFHLQCCRQEADARSACPGKQQPGLPGCQPCPCIRINRGLAEVSPHTTWATLLLLVGGSGGRVPGHEHHRWSSLVVLTLISENQRRMGQDPTSMAWLVLWLLPDTNCTCRYAYWEPSGKIYQLYKRTSVSRCNWLHISEETDVLPGPISY